MDYYACIQKSVDYIEENFQHQITLYELAEMACFSPFHFHRVFHMLVGEPVMDYVRQRRLSFAAFTLLDSDKRILDIALDCGFQSHEAFNRAFKKYYGVSPRAYRKTHINPFTIHRKAYLKNKPIIGGPFMEPTIVTKPAFHFLGFELQTTVAEGKNRIDIPRFWQHYHENDLRSKIPNPLFPHIEYGICTDFDPHTGSFTYLIGMEVDPTAKALEGMSLRSFPENEYAVFTTPKATQDTFPSSIHSTWDYIFKSWFPASNYEHAGGIEIELYDNRSSGDVDLQMDIYIPIKSREYPKK